MKMTLYLIVDPMCSWCWGFRSAWQALREELPSSVQIIDLMGGLAQDTDQPMDEPTRQYVQNAWRTVASRTSTPCLISSSGRRASRAALLIRLAGP